MGKSQLFNELIGMKKLLQAQSEGTEYTPFEPFEVNDPCVFSNGQVDVFFNQTIDSKSPLVFMDG